MVTKRIKILSRFFLFVVVFFTFTSRLYSLDPNKRLTQYDITVYTAKDGLPMNSLKKVFQDSRGYIWIGTQEGLVRFDGVEFKTYDKSQYPGLNNNFIWDIDEDNHGNIWLGTAGGGVSCFDGLKFTSYDTSDGLCNNYVNKILAAKDGTIWIGTHGGLSKFKNGEFYSFAERNSMKGRNIYSILENSKGQIVLGNSGRTLSVLDHESFKHYYSEPYRIYSMLQMKSGEIILGTDYGNIFTFSDSKIELFQNKFQKISAEVQKLIRDAVKDRHGNLWFCSETDGIIRFSKNKFDTLNVGNGLPVTTNLALSSTEDEEGNLWFAGDFGLIKLKDNKFTCFGKPEGAQSEFAHTVCEDLHGNICIGFRDSGLSLFEDQKTSNFGSEAGFPGTELLSLHPDSEGGLWLGYNHSDIINFSKGRINRLILRPEEPNSCVFSLFINNKQELWLGTNNFISKFKDNHFTTYLFDYPRPKNEIISITQTRDECVWFGTFGQGLYKIIDENISQQGIPAELRSGGVNALFTDADDVLWIGTDNLGLYRYETGNYTCYSERDGLFCDRLFSILEDDSSKLWFSTNKGVFSVRKKILADFTAGKIPNISCDEYNHLDGMREAECNGRRQPSAWRSRDGKLWFTSIAGVVSIDPNNYPVNRVKPPVYIEYFSSGDSIYLPQENAPHLNARERDIEFKYTALSFTIPERVKFKYRLIGYDKDWNQVTTNRAVNYTNIPKGRYTFQVIACNNDELWNKQGASVHFVIPPFWYERPIAIIAYFVTGILLLYWLVRRRYKRKYVEAQLKMETEHRARLEDLDKTKSRFFAGISHEFRTPLTLIEGPLQDLKASTKRKKQQAIIDMMLRNTNRLKRLVDQLLDLSYLQSHEMKMQVRPVQLIAFLKNIIAAFESYAFREEISLKLQAPENLEDTEIFMDIDKMEKVFSNLLSNAIKFTPAGGSVDLMVESPPASKDKTGGDAIKIIVKDTGRGIPHHVLPRVFDYFYQYRDENKSKESGAGIGLALSRELIHLHHGKITVISAEGRGTEIVVSLLTGKGHFKPEEISDEPPEQVEYSPGKSPLSESMVEEAPDEFDMNNSTASKPVTENLPTLLLVEDNPDMRSYITRFLEKDYRVLQAIDGEQGMKIARDEIPDLVISDVMMPKMDGFELCEQLKANELTSHIPLIMLTAKGACEDRLTGLELGAVEYLTKPFDKQELKVRIANLMKLKRQSQEQVRKELASADGPLSALPVTSADNRFLQRAIEILEQHISDPDFTARELAKNLGMSRAHLNRKLKGLTGQKTTEFIRFVRLKRAAELLRQKYGTVSEIAYESGFNHLSYFARCFKEQYGVAPSEYGG